MGPAGRPLLVGPFGQKALDVTAWGRPLEHVRIETQGPGTYVLGAAVKPRMLE